MKLALLALVGAILVLPGCGLADVFVGEDVSTTTIAGGPTSPPPTVTDAPSPPPPAWIETERGDYWLGFGSYCWGTACVDMVAPSCGSKFVPNVPVRRGEVVRFHIPFPPREVHLGLFADGRDAGGERVEPRRVVSWRVQRGGAVWLSARAKPGAAGADATYVACFRVR